MNTTRIHVFGIVQSVGFRPYISRLAAEYRLRGTVANRGAFVEIYAQGEKAAIEAFCREIPRQAPKRAAILKVQTEELDRPPFPSFSIVESSREAGDIFVSPDIATCEDCQRELFDPTNRRYLHPFINCTACGPRLTILEAMPYDRERTSMKDFPMCEACRQEYEDPEDRRYDAQPVCCNDCGPEVFLLDRPEVRGGEAIPQVRQVIASGGIAAIKGIGGFHLCCDAGSEEAVRRLRTRKHRPAKPFAIMLKDEAAVQRECLLPEAMRPMLTGPQKPILLLQKAPHSTLAPSVAPGNPKVGVMLPYAPLHLLLFSYPDDVTMPDMLVMTSGNPSGAPICHTDEEARSALSDIADVILTHDRRIRLRSDDSVMDWFEDAPYMIRRSRGFAPLPIMLSDDLRGEVLAMGGELKNSFALAKGSLIYPSPYIGDMTDLRAVLALEDSIPLLESLLEIRPNLVAVDMHPRYNTRTVAEKLGLPLLQVQHHYAHILSCMAENDVLEPVLGVAFDGTGYGTDRTIWGGEILEASPRGFTRLASIEPFLQPGGDKASREGWRIAYSLLHQCYGAEDALQLAKRYELCTEEEAHLVAFKLQQQVNCIASTSAGRLFDAISAMLGIARRSTFEGEAAMLLQFAAERAEEARTAPIRWEEYASTAEDGRLLLPTLAIFRSLVRKLNEGQCRDTLALAFHRQLASCIAFGCIAARERTGYNTVALSGGVFQNTLLLRETKSRLEKKGFAVLIHRLIPPNDGGIAVGQALAALSHLTGKHTLE